ncbi:MAG: S9 family peptidase [Hyphomicrobiales bacterium]
MAVPVAEKIDHKTSHHGKTRNDPYHWFRSENWQDVMRDPSILEEPIRAYLEQENAYTKDALKSTKTLQDQLFEEMKGRIKEDDSSVPTPDGLWSYYTSFVTGGQHPRICRKKTGGQEEIVLLDGDEMAKGKPFFQIGGASHSPDHQLLAYSIDDKGSEYFALNIKDLISGADLSDVVEDTVGSAVWAKDCSTLFYVKLDENHRPSRVYRHKLGNSQEEDVLVFEEMDPGFFVSVSATQSHEFIVISTHDHQTSEVRLIDAAKPETDPVLVAPRVREHEYSVDHQDSRLLVLTNIDDAEDFKIVETPINALGPENWKDVVAHKPGRLILSHCAYKGFMVRLEREDGLPRIVITDTHSGDEHAIAFDEEAYSLGLSAGYEFDTTTVRFTYSSMTTPAQVYDYDMANCERVLRKTQEVPSGHNPDDYVTRRIMAASHDGERVPVSVLYHKDTKMDGTAPCHLYGYGSYGISIPASFSTPVLSLVDRGFVHAIAHVRGGKDRGYRWYARGRRDNKKNTFYDFIAAGDKLIEDGLTSRGNIVCHGGSAGGMLVGAAANMAPEQYAGVIADVPFVDVLNTMLDDTLPLTPPEWLEWGNPLSDADAYDYIESYSPYDQVQEKDYPAILVMAGLTDPRVTYWEPAKWVARLRDMKTDDNLLLLKTNMEAGHGGASGRFDSLKETALTYAFALLVTGKTA